MADTYLWWRDGVIYQIYPRSFADSNGDGIGDLPGITSRLDYLVDLGIDALWLSPIYPTPDVDFGYDISDHTAIDPRFGTISDFDQLVTQAHKRGLRIILDLVLNHTSDQHKWFKEAKSSRTNAYHDWYLWQSPESKGNVPNNWQASFGGSAWEFNQDTDEYYLHLFCKEQPDVNWRNPQVRQAQLDVVRFWLKHDVDGFRLDVFNAYFKHPGFPNNPVNFGIRGFDRQKHIYDIDQPDMMPLLAEFREILNAYPERYAVGETFVATPEKAAGYCGKNALHAAFNFEFASSPWSAPTFLKSILKWETALGPDKWPNYFLNNHDISRSSSRYWPNEQDDRAKVAAVMLLTLRGTPFLYYGEEIGMRNISLKRDEILDPPGKKYWPIYKGRDVCRSPMQWNNTPYAGFSTQNPWLPVHPNYVFRNVDKQKADGNSLFNVYRQLIDIRRHEPALQHGDFLPIQTQSTNALVYLRQLDNRMIFVALNFSNRTQTVNLTSALWKKKWALLFSTNRSTTPEFRQGAFALLPNEACLLITK